MWRNVIPYAEGLCRCLAPDLIGMGERGKSLRYAYKCKDRADYLDAWFDALDLRDIILVVHDLCDLGVVKINQISDYLKGSRGPWLFAAVALLGEVHQNVSVARTVKFAPAYKILSSQFLANIINRNAKPPSY